MPADDKTPAAPVGVSYRVTKKGDGKIFTGEHTLDDEGKPTFTTYKLNDRVDGCDPAIAAALEANDLVEVLG